MAVSKKQLEELNANIKAKAESKEAVLPKPIPVATKQANLVSVVMVKTSSLYHPYQRRWVPEIQDGPIDMVLDSWLQSQIDAGIVKVVE